MLLTSPAGPVPNGQSYVPPMFSGTAWYAGLADFACLVNVAAAAPVEPSPYSQKSSGAAPVWSLGEQQTRVEGDRAGAVRQHRRFHGNGTGRLARTARQPERATGRVADGRSEERRVHRPRRGRSPASHIDSGNAVLRRRGILSRCAGGTSRPCWTSRPCGTCRPGRSGTASCRSLSALRTWRARRSPRPGDAP